jgi:hypothetical protein
MMQMTFEPQPGYQLFRERLLARKERHIRMRASK